MILCVITALYKGCKIVPDESGRGECKSWLKLSIQKTKIMASGPITSWQIDGETTEIVRDFIFLGSKITADGDFSYEIKRCFLLMAPEPPTLKPA